jgi:hypothetical protein
MISKLLLSGRWSVVCPAEALLILSLGVVAPVSPSSLKKDVMVSPVLEDSKITAK